MPVGDLVSDRAYMVIASLAWSLKAWYAMLIPDARESRRAVRMEFKSFLQRFIGLPCQIVRAGRRLVCRILGYNHHVAIFLRTFERIRRMKFT